MAQWLEHWIFIREDPGSIPMKGGIFFQLCFIPLLRLSCRKNHCAVIQMFPSLENFTYGISQLTPQLICSLLHNSVCVCVQINIYVCMYVCVRACVRACMHARAVCMYICMYVCMHACMYVCDYAPVCVCTYERMYACIYVCMFCVPESRNVSLSSMSF